VKFMCKNTIGSPFTDLINFWQIHFENRYEHQNVFFSVNQQKKDHMITHFDQNGVKNGLEFIP